MAQNINPALTLQSSPSKTNEERQNRPQDNHAVTKRLQKELMVLMISAEKEVSAFPEGENLFKWIATISGPPDTVYEGLTYKLSMEFPNSYPYAAPVVRFTTPCFHPNVDTGGNICLDILKEKWSALYDVRTILLSIQSLLGAVLITPGLVIIAAGLYFLFIEPNNESPLNTQAADLWLKQSEYKRHLHDSYFRYQKDH